jgi:hypothetical protein
VSLSAATRHPVRRALGHALIAFTVILSAACTITAGPAAPVLSTPERWFAAYHDAMRQGVFNIASFYGDEARVDLTSLGTPPTNTREDALTAIGRAFIPLPDRTQEPGDLYVSGTGAVEAAPIKEPSVDANRLVAIDEFDTQGLASQTFAMSELAWRDGSSDDPRILGVHHLARDWARAWSSGSADAVGRLYTPATLLTDDLMGVRAESGDEVGGLAATPTGSGGLPRATIDQLPGLSGPAVFVVASTGFDYSEPMQSMVMLVTADGGEGCPGHLAVVLDLDEQGRIARETRYHRIDTLSRCVDEASGDTSTTRWWDTISIPATVTKIQTRVLTLNGEDVVMFNSTPVLEELFVWAADRFTEAGLAPPIVTEVAFYDRRLDMCRDINGFTLGTTLSLCFVEGSTIGNSSEYTDWKLARATTLHELGHVWMSARGRGGPVPPEVTERFTEQAGLPTWADTAYVWQDRGVELAASTISWALTAEPVVHPRFADRFRCSQLGDLFTTLTGKPVPESARCPGYVSPPAPEG